MHGGIYLYAARHKAGITQQQLAAAVGCSQNEVARIEAGRVKTSFENLRRLIHACGYEIECSLAPLDLSYRGPINERLSATPAERVERGLHLARQIQELQRAEELPDGPRRQRHQRRVGFAEATSSATARTGEDHGDEDRARRPFRCDRCNCR